MKEKRKDPLACRNRANKNRGRAFENRCAKALGWTRVPYSGAQKGWGAGDVVDRFYERDGKWMAECKTMIGQKTGLSIKSKWRQQMVRALDGRMPLMFFTRKGAAEAWVLFRDDGFAYLGTLHHFGINVRTIEPTELGTFLIPQEVLNGAQDDYLYRLDIATEHYFLISFDLFTRLP